MMLARQSAGFFLLLLVGVMGCSDTATRETDRYGSLLETFKDNLETDEVIEFVNKRMIYAADGLVIQDSFILHFRGQRIPGYLFYSLNVERSEAKELMRLMGIEDSLQQPGNGMGHLGMIEQIRSPRNSVELAGKQGGVTKYLSLWSSDVASDILLYRLDDARKKTKVVVEFLNPWSTFSKKLPDILDLEFIAGQQSDVSGPGAFIARMDNFVQELVF